MFLEAVLASAHLLALLTLVVFQSSEAALCRADWFNAAVLRRLTRLDRLVTIAGVAVIATGVARLAWGIKGRPMFYIDQPLFHLKLALVVMMLWLVLRGSASIRRWDRDHSIAGALPPPDEIRRVRGRILASAHLLPLIAIVAVFWARGY